MIAIVDNLGDVIFIGLYGAGVFSGIALTLIVGVFVHYWRTRGNR